MTTSKTFKERLEEETFKQMFKDNLEEETFKQMFQDNLDICLFLTILNSIAVGGILLYLLFS